MRSVIFYAHRSAKVALNGVKKHPAVAALTFFSLSALSIVRHSNIGKMEIKTGDIQARDKSVVQVGRMNWIFKVNLHFNFTHDPPVDYEQESPLYAGFFRRLAPIIFKWQQQKKIQEKLSERYARELVFQHIFPGNLQHDLDHYYPSQMLLDLESNVRTKSKNISEAALLSMLCDPKKEKFHILLEGEPGIGKSTLLKYFAKKILEKKLWVIYVPLPALARVVQEAAPAHRTEVQIWCVALGVDQTSPRYQKTYEEIEQVLLALEEDKTSVVYVVDALDEVSEQDETLQKIIKRLLSKPKVILSTRSGISPETFLEDKKIVLHGLEDAAIQRFIGSYYASEEPEEREAFIQAFHHSLDVNAELKDLVKNPIFLEMFCWLLRQENAGVLVPQKSLSLVELYERAVLERARLWLKHAKQLSYANDFSKKEIEEKSVVLWEFWGDLACQAWKKDDTIFSPTFVEKIEQHHRGNLVRAGVTVRDQDVHGGFLSALRSEKSLRQQSYQFPHYTFQEYFVAWYVLRQLKKRLPRKRETVQKILVDILGPDYIEQLLREDSRVLPFLLGLWSRVSPADFENTSDFEAVRAALQTIMVDLSQHHEKNEASNSALLVSLNELDPEYLKFFPDLARRLKLNQTEKNAWLLQAARRGLNQSVQWLLDNNADIHTQSSDYFFGNTALHHAALQGHASTAALLLSNRAQIEAKSDDDKTPLHLAVTFGGVAVTRFLLSQNADVHTIDIEGSTVLHNAVGSSDAIPEIADLVLKRGASPRVRDFEGRTPLHYATCLQNIPIAELLLRDGVVLEMKSYVKTTEEYGAWMTPLQAASFYGLTKMINFFLDKKAEVNSRDSEGRTALHIAAMSSQSEIAEQLLNYHADANALTTEGWLPLHYAAMSGNLECVKLLLSKTADFEAKTTDGFNCLDITSAVKNGLDLKDNNDVEKFIKLTSLEQGLKAYDTTHRTEDFDVAVETAKANLQFLKSIDMLHYALINIHTLHS